MRLPFATGFTSEAARFQWRLLTVLALVVLTTASTALWLARNNIALDEEHRRETEFQVSLALMRSDQRHQHAMLVERSRALATKSRIQAALEDGAEDLLYLSARDELRDLLDDLPNRTTGRRTARFYRFLDSNGHLIVPEQGTAGVLAENEEAKLSLTAVPDEPQIGYLLLHGDGDKEVLHELVVVPIMSTTDGRKLAALVLGFTPHRLETVSDNTVFSNGIWMEGRFHIQKAGTKNISSLFTALERWIRSGAASGGRLRIVTADGSWLVFAQQIEIASFYPPAYEVCAFPLDEMLERQRVLGWRVIGVGAGVMALGLALSYFISFRLSKPVEQLAHDSQEQRVRRVKAEAALETTSAELDRAARFSANASHQLKTPVAVLRAGLEMLHSRGNLGETEAHEIAVLIHQTYRISSVIEDLLLLSRLDAGQLRLNFSSVNLSELVAAVLDDLSALPAETEMTVEQDCPPDLRIAGEKRYTALILQNLLENAQKYNRPAGRIRVAAHIQGDEVLLTVGNTALRPIPPEAREHIFERFHRGGLGENIPGYGLGLNLSRELARIHHGDLRLVRSDEAWTEFVVTFRLATPGSTPP